MSFRLHGFQTLPMRLSRLYRSKDVLTPGRQSRRLALAFVPSQRKPPSCSSGIISTVSEKVDFSHGNCFQLAYPASLRGFGRYQASYSRQKPPSVNCGTDRNGGEVSPGFSADGTEVYRNVKRMSSAGISLLAVGQGGFWLATVYMTTGVADALLSPLWTVGGAGLSLLFTGMVHAYLRRSVAVLTVHGAGASRVSATTYAFGGFLRKPVDIDTKNLVGGPKGADPKERHWTFGVQDKKGSGAAYYLVDTKGGVLDRKAVSAVCSTPFGGESLLVLAHRRRAGEFKGRWSDWEKGKDVVSPQNSTD